MKKKKVVSKWCVRVRCLQTLISLEPLLILPPNSPNLSPHTSILTPHTCPPNRPKVDT